MNGPLLAALDAALEGRLDPRGALAAVLREHRDDVERAESLAWQAAALARVENTRRAT